MPAPETVQLCADTEIGPGALIEPYVVFGPGVRVGREAVIHSFCHLERAIVGAGAEIGPFARLRPGSDIGEGAKLGNFVETKNTRLEPGAKANHLSYLGDAMVGARANVGAGTITCNYDGFGKHATRIGAGCLHRLEHGAGGAGLDRGRRHRRRRQRHHPRRPGRRAGGGAGAPGARARIARSGCASSCDGARTAEQRRRPTPAPAGRGDQAHAAHS